VQRGHVIHKAEVLLGREGPVGREQMCGDVTQQHPAYGTVEAARHHRRVDDVRHPFQQPDLPQANVALARVPGGPQQPVVAGILILQHVALAVDDDPFKACARFGVLGHPRLAAASRRQQIVQAANGLRR
jgi:hypothetical protein